MSHATSADAIAHYHDLLTPDVAADSWNDLDTALRFERLVFGQRTICNVLRPYFLTQDEARTLYESGRNVASSLAKVFERIPTAEWEPTLGLSSAEAALARVEAGFSPVVTIGRLDGFLTREGGLGFIEFNSESPGGIGFGAALARIFGDLPVMRRFCQRYSVRFEPVLDHTLDALVHSYRAWGGTSANPRIAIVDRREAPTYTEFELCRDAFVARGHEVRIVDPAELEISDKKLRAGAFEIDLVYRRIVASDVAANLGLDHPLVIAGRERLACIASGFGAFAMLSKALFALLSDPETSSFLDEREREAVDRCVPWTRIVRDGQTTDWNRTPVDLLEFAEREREQLVVKPCTEYGGSGVHLGWLTSPDEWPALVRSAADRPSVLQRRVAVPSEAFPRFSGGTVEYPEYFADVDPYVFAGRTGLGAGTRLSPSQLLNVSAGGGSAVPVFVVSPRP